MTDPRTIVYTDGACSGNPGPGGWGWVVPDGEAGFGGAPATTNQRMELTAVIEAVRALPGPLHIISDSTYVVNCFRDEWWKGWLKRGWKNSQKQPVANRDLWEPLIELYQQRDITFGWIKGHSGDRWNDRADELAVAGRDGALGPKAVASARSAGADTVARSAIMGGEHKIAIVGHRPPEIGGYGPNRVADGIRHKVREILAANAKVHGEVVVLSGLQLGVETLGVEAALEAGVDFIAVLAFPDPSARWPAAAQKRFDELIDQARDVIVLERAVPATPAEMAKAFERRDRWLAKEADEAIVVWDGVHRGVGAQQRLFEAAVEALWPIDPAQFGG